MQSDINSLLGWIYRDIDFSNITAPIWRQPVRPSESFDWVLERVQARYFSDAEDPSAFLNVEWRLEVPPRGHNLQEIPVKIPLTLNPGIYDQTAGTTRPKEYFFKSPIIDWPILALENFTIHIENHVTPGGVHAGVLDLLFIGHFVADKPFEIAE